MHVLICGGGVIGAAIAFFLSCRGVKATVIERTGLACAASGKSGGFLARDWCDGSPLAPLAQRSFALHADLAARIADDWCYRRLDTYGGFAGFPRRRSSHDLGWLSDEVTIGQMLGTPETTAQVHPGQFTAAMMRAAEAQGAELRLGRVTGFRQHAGRAAGVEVDGETVDGDAVVVAMGPWSILAALWLPLPFRVGKIGRHADHLVVDGAVVSPKPGAVSSEEPLPLDPAQVAPDPGAIERLEAMCASFSPTLAAPKILAQQACFRPVTSDGLPLIGAVPGVAGAYIATGHSVWGILNAPATGEAISELIVDGAAHSVDLSPFDPGRLPPLDPARLRGYA